MSLSQVLTTVFKIFYVVLLFIQAKKNRKIKTVFKIKKNSILQMDSQLKLLILGHNDFYAIQYKVQDLFYCFFFFFVCLS